MKSKKFLCVIALILTFISIFSIISFALTTGVVNDGTAGSYMNMRKGPGTSYAKIVSVPNNTSVVINGEKPCDDGTTSSSWYNVTCTVSGKEYTGYISASGIVNIKTDSSSSGYVQGLSDAVPDIYQSYIKSLQQKHPNWKFKYYYTGLDWSDVIKNETKPRVNAIEGTSYPVSYRSTTVFYTAGGSDTGVINGTDGSLNLRDGPGTKNHSVIIAIPNGTKVTILATVPCDDGSTGVNWYKISVTLNGKSYVGYVSSNLVKISSSSFTPVEGSNWYQAHGQVVAYYIDPRNFLNEKDIFQFEELTYNSSVQKIAGVKSIIKGSFMDNVSISTTDGKTITYAEAFMEAGKKYKVSPYHLSSKVIQEVGKSGSKSTSGTNSTYPSIYNFYNIGAYTGYLDGLKWAYNDNKAGTYGRPWNTQYKSIIGGAEFISSGYISKGQNTPYFEKFDFIADGGLYSHQYAIDVTYSMVQARKTYNSVYSNMLSTDFCFIIPVFRNMPRSVCKLPASSSQPNLAPDCPKLTDTVDPKPVGTVVEPTPKPPVEVPVVIIPNANTGDVNEDGNVTIADAKCILKHLAGASNKVFNSANADINSDGSVTLLDAKWILQVNAGLRDLKVAEEVNPLAAVEIKTDAYSFCMPSGWSYSSDMMALVKNKTDNKCIVKVDNAGEQNAEYNYTLDNTFSQALGELSETADEISRSSSNTALVNSGEFKLKGSNTTVKYCEYIVKDSSNNVTDYRYVGFVLINNCIYCINYICNEGKGYSADFDFTNQISEYFKLK